MAISFDKAYGCLAGLALGDALGMPTECMTPEQIVEEFGAIRGLVPAPAWHPHSGLPFGSITDDTEQALALADIYARGDRMTAERAAQAIVAWADAQAAHLDLYIGPSTRMALQALKSGADPRKSGQKGTTNGAAMRVAPVGVVHAGRCDRALADAVEACLPTHGTMLAISGAAAVAFAVGEAMTESPTVESVLYAAMQGAVEGREHGAWVWTPPLEHRIALAVRLVREAQGEADARESLYRHIGVDITVSESVPAALGLVALAKGDPMRAVLNAAQIGGDTDTIGAIAGAICGALSGIEAIDRDMLAMVEETNRLDLAKVAENLVIAAERLEQEDDPHRL